MLSNLDKCFQLDIGIQATIKGDTSIQEFYNIMINF